MFAYNNNYHKPMASSSFPPLAPPTDGSVSPTYYFNSPQPSHQPYYYYPRVPQSYYYTQPNMVNGMPYVQGIAITGNVVPDMRRKSTTWTPKEDKLLRQLKEVQKLGWREISSFFDDRTPNACQFRWRRIISGTSSSVQTRKRQSISFLLN